jgi:hypothetical protein
MPNVTETSQWENGIYRFETTDPIVGGETGIDNLPHKQLGNRTQYLKDQAILQGRLRRDQVTADYENQVRLNTATKRLESWDGSAWTPVDISATVITDASKVGGNLPAAFATAAQGTKADNALPSSSFNPAVFATSAQGTRADNALPSASYTDVSVFNKFVSYMGVPTTALAAAFWAVIDAAMWDPGDTKWTFSSTPGRRWLEMDGWMIGREDSYLYSASKGFTGTQIQALFTKLWTLRKPTGATIWAPNGTTVAMGSSAAVDFNNGYALPLPDMRGSFPRGWDHGRGIDTDRVLGSTQIDAMQRIQGGFAIDDRAAGNSTGAFVTDVPANVGAGGSDTGYLMKFDSARVVKTSETETRPHNVAGMWVIRY